MAEFSEENVWRADTRKSSLVNKSGKLVLLPGTGPTHVLDCLAGRYNLYVPHVPWDQVDPRIHFHSTGFLLVHDSWQDDWATKGAFGVEGLPIEKAVCRIDCSNYVLGIADAGFSLASEFVQEQDYRAAKRLEIECLRQMAYDCVTPLMRSHWDLSYWEKNGYVDESRLLCGFPVNYARAYPALLSLYKMGSLVVRIECRYDLKGMRLSSREVASPCFSSETNAWHEAVGKSVYEDIFGTFAQAMMDWFTPAKEERRRRVEKKLRKMRYALRSSLSDETDEEEKTKAFPVAAYNPFFSGPFSLSPHALAMASSVMMLMSPYSSPTAAAAAAPKKTIYDTFE